MRNKEHLTPDQLTALKDGLLSREEAISALEHIGECEQCAETLAESYTTRELLELSPGFQSAVFAAIDREQRDIRRERSKAAKGRRELYRYSFRVSVAACITLLLLFSGTINYGLNLSRAIYTDLPQANVITENLRGFSDRLIDFEVTKYLKEEE